MTNKVKQIEDRASFETRIRNRMSKNDFMRVMYAYDIAKNAHGHMKQFRKDTNRRYFEHPRDLCLILMDELEVYSPSLLIRALLHDTIEDTSIWGNITKGYHQCIESARYRMEPSFPFEYGYVIRMTKPNVDNIDFHSKKEVMDFYTHQLFANDGSVFDKMLDRLSNLREMSQSNSAFIRKQIKETEDVFLERFKQNCESGQYILWQDGSTTIGKLSSKLFSLIDESIKELKKSIELHSIYELKFEESVELEDNYPGTNYTSVYCWFEDQIEQAKKFGERNGYGEMKEFHLIEVSQKQIELADKENRFFSVCID